VVVLYFAVITAAVAAGVLLARSAISVTGEAVPTTFLVVAKLSFLPVSPMEELFFWGVVQETMAEVVPGTTAVALASATFAGIHYLTYVGPLAGKLVLVGSCSSRRSFSGSRTSGPGTSSSAPSSTAVTTRPSLCSPTSCSAWAWPETDCHQWYTISRSEEAVRLLDRWFVDFSMKEIRVPC
jgi:hypothetical protein